MIISNMWSSDENLGRLLQEVDQLFPAPMEESMV